MRTETARQEERIQNKARLPIGGNRQRYLFRGRFLCKHFSSRSLFSHASGLAEAGRAVPGSPAALRTENLLQSGLWRALCDRPFCVYRTCLPFVQPLLSSVQPLRVSTLSSSFSLPSITQPTNQPTKYHCTTLTLHTNIERHTFSPGAIRDPARSALKRDIRALTSPPAWLAAVALPCTPFASTVKTTPAYIHLPATNICCITARSLPYMEEYSWL